MCHFDSSASSSLAMTITKAQGHTLIIEGLNLQILCFPHDQLCMNALEFVLQITCIFILLTLGKHSLPWSIIEVCSLLKHYYRDGVFSNEATLFSYTLLQYRYLYVLIHHPILYICRTRTCFSGVGAKISF